MDFEEYKRKFFVSPAPDQQFQIVGLKGAAIYVSDYAKALDFYTKLFGSPQYSEGDSTRGWKIGASWLSLFPSEKDDPRNVEITLALETKSEVDRLYKAFISLGAKGEPPEETLMYSPVYLAFVVDPIGLAWILVNEIPLK
jgi:catechol 2,3-dioxygenase-like lactoylglutathione lyase family enzyme